MFDKRIIIAIDGHSSTGKSSFAKAVAAKLGYTYIDSGAIYRAITFFALQNNIIANQMVKQLLQAALPQLSIEIRNSETDPKAPPLIFLNKENISSQIRGLAVSEMVSQVSALPFVREYVDGLLQTWGKNKSIVMDGRDIGTVIFPQAELKIFMTAAAEVRAQRRFKELMEKGETASYEEILENIKQRDYLDTRRSTSPLRMAPDALLLDNTYLTPEDQMQWIEKIIAERWA